MSNYEEIQNALSYIDSRDREVWFEIGAALKDELGEDGYTLWDNWSQSAENYKAQDAKAVWKSIKPGHIHIASLFHHARAAGYKPAQPYVPPTAQEQARRSAEAQARQQAEEKARIEKQKAVKATAQSIWSRAKPANLAHPYLVDKHITATDAIVGLRQNPYKGDLNLLVPVLYEREIVNVQSINQDGSKRFLAGGQVKGGYTVVGDAAKTENGVVIAEGYATAASIYQATGKPVIVAFNAGNMVTVSERLAKTLPSDVPVILAVDNDASQTGIKKAQQAAAFFGDRAQAIQPEFSMTQIQQYQREKGLDAAGHPQLPSDFNDLHHLAGIDAVKAFLSAQQPAPLKTIEEVLPVQSEAVHDMEQAIIDEARLRGMPPPSFSSSKTQQEAALEAASLPLETTLMPEQKTTTATTAASMSNSIEFDDKQQMHEPVKPVAAVEPVKPDQIPAAKTEPEAAADALKRPILDLNYRIPPDSIKSRYIVAAGQYLSVQNGTTVLFEDTGKKISTAKTDTQTINDMLEVAKAKGWDSIKLSGSKEFKQMMYVAAESQGIRTKGYVPTPADLALVEHLRLDKSLNSIEPTPVHQPKINTPLEPAVQTASVGGGERIVAHGAAPYQHDPKQQESYYLTLAKNGKERTVWGVGLPAALEKSGAQVGDIINLQSLGKQPVEIEVAVHDAEGKVIGHETKGTQRNVFEIDVLERSNKPDNKVERQLEQEIGKDTEKQQDEKIHTQPDAAAISASEKMMAQGSLPSQQQVNVSERVDMNPHVSIHAIGGEVLHSEVKHHAEQLKAAALDTRLVSAKQVYMEKAGKLSKPDQARLQFYERHTLDTIRDAREDIRTEAMRNYYEYTAKHMNGSKLNLPKPVQIPGQSPSTELKQADRHQAQTASYGQGVEEPEYGR